MNPSAENHFSNTNADWCTTERDARRSLESARGSRDPSLLDNALAQLGEAWLARANAALEHAAEHGVQCTEVPKDDEFVPEPGIHLITAPQVGADARRLLTAGLEHGVPVLALAREPMTKLGERPVALLGRGVVVRTRVEPENDADHPSLEWWKMAFSALVEAAQRADDPTASPERRLEIMLDRLDGLPGLSTELIEDARELAAIKSE
jgi:hypothetical protein